MTEIVVSVQRVAAIIAEISAAIGSLDRMTRQYAALVEEGAAAAESLKDQAARLSETVGAFRVTA